MINKKDGRLTDGHLEILTKKLKNSLWLLVRLLCDCTFQLQNRLYLHPVIRGRALRTA
ncbi:hypothetical protein [Mesobacillus boroniphilus]|uniref:hypothetical protein n=1 Tax=Mesobacillus boroniphilus TaxID=308892 RepID=UPI001BD10B59|nr:hypothetical protein [Mesobacillus boroniphilus]